VRAQSRYLVLVTAVPEMAKQPVSSDACVDVAAIAARRRLEREAARVVGVNASRSEARTVVVSHVYGGCGTKYLPSAVPGARFSAYLS
jgi:hypothetical protein